MIKLILKHCIYQICIIFIFHRLKNNFDRYKNENKYYDPSKLFITISMPVIRNAFPSTFAMEMELGYKPDD